VSVRRLLPEDAKHYQSVRLQDLLECPSTFVSSCAEEAGRAPAVIALYQRVGCQVDGALLECSISAGLTLKANDESDYGRGLYSACL